MKGGSSKIWVVGMGKVGARALKLLSRRAAGASITAVDRHPFEAPGGTAIEMDGVEFLLERLDAGTDAWIVPAAPTHLAFEWLYRKLAADGHVSKIPLPPDLGAGIPSFTEGENDRAYVSNATFICPPGCEEPDICTHTGQPRPLVMHEHLASLNLGPVPLVLRSHQLAPGVGGFLARDLWAAYGIAAARPGRYLVATACRCHGVVDAFERR